MPPGRMATYRNKSNQGSGPFTLHRPPHTTLPAQGEPDLSLPHTFHPSQPEHCPSGTQPSKLLSPSSLNPTREIYILPWEKLFTPGHDQDPGKMKIVLAVLLAVILCAEQGETSREAPCAARQTRCRSGLSNGGSRGCCQPTRPSPAQLGALTAPGQGRGQGSMVAGPHGCAVVRASGLEPHKISSCDLSHPRGSTHLPRTSVTPLGAGAASPGAPIPAGQDPNPLPHRWSHPPAQQRVSVDFVAPCTTSSRRWGIRGASSPLG